MSSFDRRCVAIERLTPVSLLGAILQARGNVQAGRPRFGWWSASPAGERLFAWLRHRGGVEGGPLDYDFIDVCDAAGGWVGPQIESTDSLEIGTAIAERFFRHDPLIRHCERWCAGERLQLYLSKRAAEELRPALGMIRVAAWWGQGQGDPQPTLCMAARPWRHELDAYASRFGVVLRWYWGAGRLPFAGALRRSWHLLVGALRARRALPVGRSACAKALGRTGSRVPTVMALFSGKTVGLDLSQNTDLFWVPFASLRPHQLVVAFSRTDDMLDADKASRLAQAGIRVVALQPGARASDRLPLWDAPGTLARLSTAVGAGWRLAFVRGSVWPLRPESRWIVKRIVAFALQCEYWRRLFKAYEVQVYVDPADSVPEAVAAAEAMAQRGGLTVSYQRSDESVASLFHASAVDIAFAWSKAFTSIERRSGSKIRILLASGYPHDHAIVRVRERAKALRRTLVQRGSKFIVCFLDEGSSADPRWLPSHAYRAENYRFLLDKMLEDPHLGLIFKPKKPATLRQRLGVVAELLDRGLATGRCTLLADGIASTSTLPCEASQAADVTIGLLSGTTASLESALSGTPTVLLDRERFRSHPLYAFQGQIVFSSWEELWEALRGFRENPDLGGGIGDWSPVIGRFDDFQDGRAAERIGGCIGSVAAALAARCPREEALRIATEQYRRQWGVWTVVEFGSDVPDLGDSRLMFETPRAADAAVASGRVSL